MIFTSKQEEAVLGFAAGGILVWLAQRILEVVWSTKMTRPEVEVLIRQALKDFEEQDRRRDELMVRELQAEVQGLKDRISDLLEERHRY